MDRILRVQTTKRESIGKRLGHLACLPAKSKAVDWLPQHVVIPGETETPGAFDFNLVPHLRGIIEAADDPGVRHIYLCLAARLAKTTTGISILIHGVAEDPAPALFVSSDRDRTFDTIDGQFYPMLQACRATRDLVPPVHRRNKAHINCRHSKIRIAWSSSPSRLAGYPAKRILCSEVSKWSKDASSEADALYLVEQRAKNYPDCKIIYESTPGTVGKCNITHLLTREGTDQRRYWVPCPECGTFQTLEFGDASTRHGVKWEKNSRDRSDPNIAERTAWYQCVNGCRIEDEHRPRMMRRGVWLSEGQTVDVDGTIHGERPKSPHVGFGPLSSLYSLMIPGWGQIAREFLDARYDREALRNFYNSTLALPWDPSPQAVKPSQVVLHMGSDDPLGIVPEWACFLTAAVDVSALADDYLFDWGVCAWGPNERGSLVDMGRTPFLDDFLKWLVTLEYPTADGGTMPVGRVGIDSGSFSQMVYGIRQKFPGFVWALKGSSTSLENPFPKRDFPEMFRGMMAKAGRDPKVVEALRARRLYDLIEVNTHRSQQWLEDRLCGRIKRDDPCWFSIPRQAFEEEIIPGVDLAKHLLGDRLSETGTWEKRYEEQHCRDWLRYNIVMAYQRTRNGADWANLKRQPPQRSASTRGTNPPVVNQSTAGGWLPRR